MNTVYVAVGPMLVQGECGHLTRHPRLWVASQLAMVKHTAADGTWSYRMERVPLDPRAGIEP